MGMMKELVRGPIKCCETLAQDTLYQLRAEALLHHSEFHVVENVSIAREKRDKLPGTSLIRFLGSQKTYTDRKLLVDMLRVFLEGDFGVLEDLGWEPDDYSHEDLVLEEYCKVSINSTTCITSNWSSPVGATTCNSLMYYVKPRPFDKNNEEPTPPSLEELKSMDRPPFHYEQETWDYLFHTFVGQVMLLLLL